MNVDSSFPRDQVNSIAPKGRLFTGRACARVPLFHVIILGVLPQGVGDIALGSNGATEGDRVGSTKGKTPRVIGSRVEPARFRKLSPCRLGGAP